MNKFAIFCAIFALSGCLSAPQEIEGTSQDKTPFGVVHKVCNISTGQLGAKVETRSGFKLYDSDPAKTGARVFYVTGFQDGCPRKFTAGLAMLGDPLVYGVKLYSNNSSFSKLDNSYERLKNNICRVKSRQPCGDRGDTLVKTTVLVSIYRRFSDAQDSGVLLLHKGELYSTHFK